MTAASFMEAYQAGTVPSSFWGPQVRELHTSHDGLGEYTIFEVSRSGDNIVLCGIAVADKSWGTGTRSMQWLLSLADEHGCTVELTVQPVGNGSTYVAKGLNRGQLRRWYRSMGFKFNQYWEGVRLPNSTA